MRSGTALPQPLQSGLSRVALRWKQLAAMRGLGRLLVALVVVAIVAMVLDFWFPLPVTVRWALWLGWFVLVLVGIARGLFRILGKSLSLSDLAAIAETGHPELAERISSTVGLLNPHTTAHGSSSLITVLAQETTGRVESLDLTRSLSSAVPRSWLTAGLLSVLVLVLPPLVRPDPFARLTQRFFQPWIETERIGRFEFMVTPGNTVVARGDDFKVWVEIYARLNWAGSAPTDASIEWTDVAGKTHLDRLRIQAADATTRGHRFTSVLKALDQSIRYRVLTGSDSSTWHQVTVVEPPVVQQIAARVEPPPYTQFPTATVRDPDRLSAWEGSRVTLTVTPNRTMTRVALGWPVPVTTRPEASVSSNELDSGTKPPDARESMASEEKILELTPSGENGVWVGSAEAVSSGTYRLILEDENHLVNRPESPRRVIVIPDQPPELAIGGTDDALDVRKDDLIVVEVAARDDVAVSSVVLRYVVDRAGQGSHGVEGASRPDQGELPAPLTDLGTPLARGQASLTLKSLDLQPGDVVAYAFEALDNYPPPNGPHKTRTKPRRVIVRDQADSFAALQGRAERESLRARLEQIKTSLNSHHQATVQLRYAADAALRGNGQWEASHKQGLSDRVKESDQHIQLLDDLSRDLSDTGRLASLAKPTQQIAEVEATGVREILGRVDEEKDAAKRLANLRLADSRIGTLEMRLADLIKKFDDMAKEDEDRRKLQVLAESQEDLARRAEEFAEAKRAPEDLEALKRDQDALKQQVDEIVRRSPELKAEMLARQVEQADELARAARELADRQRGQERQTADSSVRQILLREIAQEQQALVDDARKLAMDVDAPLQENFRAKINLEPLVQPIDPLERGDLEPARQRIDQAQGELNRLMRDMDDIRNDPKALARRLAQRQDEVTQRLNSAQQQANTPEKQAEQVKTIENLVSRQEAISRMAEQLLIPEAQKQALTDARESTRRVLEALRGKPDPDQVARAQEAKDALQRLADATPEAWQRRQQSLQQAQEARQKLDEVARAVEGHLRETEQAANSNRTPIKAAFELANRLEPLVQQAEQAAKTLSGVDTMGMAEPQRETAQRRAEALAGLLKEVRQKAPSEAEANKLVDPGADNQAPTSDEAFRLAELAQLRQRLDRSPSDARTSVDRLQQAIEGRMPADQRALELAAELRSMQQLKMSPDQQFQILQQASAALKAISAPDALTFQAEAIRMAEQAANSLVQAHEQQEATKPEEGQPPVASNPTVDNAEKNLSELAQATENLARRLADKLPSSEQVTVLAQAQEALAESAKTRDAAAQAREQRAIAADLARVPASSRSEANQARENAEQGVAQAVTLNDRLASPSSPAESSKPMTEARREAAKALQNLARAIKAGDQLAAQGKPGDQQIHAPNLKLGQANEKQAEFSGVMTQVEDPELGLVDIHREAVRNLSNRQRRISEQLQSVLGKEMKPQEALRDETSTLSKTMEALRQQLGEQGLSQSAQGPAQNASNALQQQAANAMNQSLEHMAQGRLPSARDSQRQAADHLENAARQASDLASALRKDIPPDTQPQGQRDGERPEGQGSADQNSRSLAEARDAQNQAARELAQAQGAAKGQTPGNPEAPTRNASDAMRRAAQGLRAAAASTQNGERLAQSLKERSQQSNPSTANGSTPETAPGQEVAAHLGALDPAQLARSGRRWGELPGHLRNEILQMSQGRYRDDYARLIQLYFREIGGANLDAKPETQP